MTLEEIIIEIQPLIVKHLLHELTKSEELTISEKSKLEGWINASPRNQQLFLQLTNLNYVKNRLKELKALKKKEKECLIEIKKTLIFNN